MKEEQKNSTYTAEDIQNYLTGKLTPIEMNKLEKAALNDPFLAEAIEGYEGIPQKNWQKELSDLKQHFTQQHTPAKVIEFKKQPYKWFRAAAAILIIGITATASYLLFTKKDNTKIAQQVSVTSTTQDSIKSDTATQVSSYLATTENNIAKNSEPTDNTKLITRKADDFFANVKVDSSFIYKPGNVATPASGSVAIERKDNDVAATNNQNAALPTTANAPSAGILNTNTINENEAIAKNKSAASDALFDKAQEKREVAKELPLNKSFLAQVVSQDNTPLPFANISIKSENFGTYADVKGNFRLVSSDSVLTVEIKSVGYKPQYYTLKSNVAQNKIILAEDDMAFKKQTVVVGNSATKSKLSQKKLVIKDSVTNVEPVDGWDNYNTYVDNNITIPDDIRQNNIHGQVELSFEVKGNGAITNVKVDKSLCNNCDEAAKRLLQSGPQWKIKKGKKGKGKIAVQF
jgi:hypothetical protein